MEESNSPSPPTSPERMSFHTPTHFLSGSSREPSPPKRFTPIPPQFSTPLKDQKVREGERAVLQCYINPYPEPQKIQWFKNQLEIHQSPDYKLGYRNGACTLEIEEVFPEDAGSFTCTITVNDQSNSTTMYLIVEGALRKSEKQREFLYSVEC